MDSDRTPEQIAADDALEAAIIAHAQVYGSLEPGDYLGPWIVVASAERISDPGSTPYLLAFQGGLMPTHVSLGLLAVGADIVRDVADGYEHE